MLEDNLFIFILGQAFVVLKFHHNPSTPSSPTFTHPENITRSFTPNLSLFIAIPVAMME